MSHKKRWRKSEKKQLIAVQLEILPEKTRRSIVVFLYQLNLLGTKNFRSRNVVVLLEGESNEWIKQDMFNFVIIEISKGMCLY